MYVMLYILNACLSVNLDTKYVCNAVYIECMFICKSKYKYVCKAVDIECMFIYKSKYKICM